MASRGPRPQGLRRLLPVALLAGALLAHVLRSPAEASGPGFRAEASGRAWLAPSRRSASPCRSASPVALRAGGAGGALDGLKVNIVGAGPSGLLLAHKLLGKGASVDIFEGRPDPRKSEGLEGRAYALGLGIRGRTAIRTVDDGLWDRIKELGFGSEKFKLHLSPTFALDLRTKEDAPEGLEPSLLVYQSDLCGALLDELEERHASGGKLRTVFGALVKSVDSSDASVELEDPRGDGMGGPADLVAGCDGVNSRVRKAIAKACAGFGSTEKALPGSLKVLRIPKMPDTLDFDAVHAIPGAGGSSAFVEPTARGVCVLVNWRDAPAGGDKDKAASVSLGDLTDATEARDELRKRFPLLADVVDTAAGEQFVSQEKTRAVTIKCNTYHHGAAVLLGDSAHSTGGASGQGCNSALQDSVALADCLERTGGDVKKALLAYSQSRVPEGQALLDLSIGPGEEAGPLRKALYGAASFKDTILSRLKLGDPPLQTILTTTLTSFKELRRQRDFFFGDFPSDAEFEKSIAALAAAAEGKERQS